ncbi:hypothetical protein CDL12_05431 [Handroanthus impetiginosus]|uniref:Calmodulin-binding protein n=1 Tax=Handroanthus impetiginosus TaxID=429701 RepID=A0A2G9HWH4_9LAMI|nr:hypothetical protein CDL12_05431 [Handroanthus impetiginosus]
MEEELENPATANTAVAGKGYSDDLDSCCSTPYVSAPSSPGRGAPLSGFYYSAPASPTHFMLSTTNLNPYPSASVAAAASDANCSFEFDFSPTLPSTGASTPESMTSADELFLNGQIRPMKLSTHLQRPQLLAPLIESDDVAEEEQIFSRGRDLKFRAGSLRRRTRSMSPLRASDTTSFQWEDDKEGKRKHEELAHKNANDFEEDKGSNETTPCASRSSSAGRSSRRWVFLKEFLYRSKSEGRNEGHKFWSSLSFSPVKDKKMPPSSNSKVKEHSSGVDLEGKKRTGNKNGVGKRRGPSPSPHELHYTANRAQAEDMRRKTFLPYRQGLLGCLGFSSKSYGAMNGFARALNPVSSR